MPVKNAQLSLNELFVLVLSDGIITPEEHELLLNFSRGTVKTIDARLATRQDSPTRGELGLKERDSNPVPSSSPPKGAE